MKAAASPNCTLRVLAPLIATVAVLTLASQAAAVDRGQFVERADAICKKAKPSVNSKLRRAERWLKRGDAGVRPALRLLDAALNRWKAMLDDLGDLERPEGDGLKIGRWLFYEREQVHEIQRATRQIRKGNFVGATLSLDRAERKGNRAERIVGGFGFEECT